VQHQRRGDRLAGRFRRDVADLGHLAQDVVAARGRAARLAERVVGARRLREPGQEGGLGQRELGRALVEEGPRGGLDADRRLAAVRPVGHGVEVLREDPLLALAAGVLVLELLGELGLADLALQRPFAGDVEAADELHRQG
jgi:hypothetical protein